MRIFVPPPLVATPLVTDKRYVTHPWLEWLTTLVRAVNGAGVDFTSGVLANIPTNLGPADEGRMYLATDYKHTWRWDGAGWHFIDEGSGASGHALGLFHGAPPGALWAPCNGGSALVSQDNGTISTMTIPLVTQSGVTGSVGDLSPYFRR